MLTYYLNNQATSGPLQLDGLTLKKSRHRKYWGFLYRKLGYVEGLSSIRFEEPDAVATLNDALDRDGIQAETTFRIEQNGAVLYDGFIDYATYASDGAGVTAGLRDNRAVVDVSANLTTMYGVAPTESVQLPERKLGGLPSLLVDAGTVLIQRSEAAAVPLTHSVPLTRRSDKDDTIAGSLAPVVTPLASDPCYYNTSARTQTVQVSGLVSVSASASATRLATLRAVSGSVVREVGRWAVAAAPVLIQAVVSVAVEVAAGASLKLEWVADGGATNWSFLYDTTTQISLSDEKSYPPSRGRGRLVLDVLAELIDRAALGRLTFRSDWLVTGDGANLLLLNGAGVRGIYKTMPVSIDSVFAGLNAVFNLAMWVEGDVVRLEPKTGRVRALSRVEAILSRSESMATDFLYNSVQAGYSQWQAEGATLSNDEPNGRRSYSTGITAVRNELNLVSDLITASGLIETQRRKQYDPKTASENKADSLDDRLFLLCTVRNAGGYRAETGERTQWATGNYQPGTLLNTYLTPGRNLWRWRFWLAASLPLSSETLEGSDTLVTQMNGLLISEKSPVSSSTAPNPRLSRITAPMSLTEYADVGDWLEYPYRGQWRTGEVLDIEWRQTKDGETAAITLLERTELQLVH